MKTGFKIVLCDDDALFLDILRRKIEVWMTEADRECTVKCYADGRMLTEQSVWDGDLYFLDIDMPGENGMSLAEMVSRENGEAAIIFVSNHEEFVFEAIHYAPLRFLRKEWLDEELGEALDAWLIRQRCRNEVLTVQAKTGMAVIPCSEIHYIESFRHYMQIHCEKMVYEVRGRLGDYEEKLKDSGFVRVNIGCLVNCRYIKLLRNGQVTLISGEGFTVGRARREEVKHAYMKYVREKSLWRS